MLPPPHVLSSLKDRVKKVTVEKEALESHLKNEKDEKELYKVMCCFFLLPHLFVFKVSLKVL